MFEEAESPGFPFRAQKLHKILKYTLSDTQHLGLLLGQVTITKDVSWLSVCLGLISHVKGPHKQATSPAQQGPHKDFPTNLALVL